MVTEEEVAAIGRTLLDAAQPLPARFRALFTLRNLGGPAAIDCIVRGFADSSALLKHELAFCLGQMRDRAAIPALLGVLQDSRQEPMVRHEAGMALQDTTCRCAARHHIPWPDRLARPRLPTGRCHGSGFWGGGHGGVPEWPRRPMASWLCQQ